MSDPIVDRDFAERFLTTVARPFDQREFFLFHDWWAAASPEAIEVYVADLAAAPGAAVRAQVAGSPVLPGTRTSADISSRQLPQMP